MAFINKVKKWVFFATTCFFYVFLITSSQTLWGQSENETNTGDASSISPSKPLATIEWLTGDKPPIEMMDKTLMIEDAASLSIKSHFFPGLTITLGDNSSDTDSIVIILPAQEREKIKKLKIKEPSFWVQLIFKKPPIFQKCSGCHSDPIIISIDSERYLAAIPVSPSAEFIQLSLDKFSIGDNSILAENSGFVTDNKKTYFENFAEISPTKNKPEKAIIIIHKYKPEGFAAEIKILDIFWQKRFFPPLSLLEDKKRLPVKKNTNHSLLDNIDTLHYLSSEANRLSAQEEYQKLNTLINKLKKTKASKDPLKELLFDIPHKILENFVDLDVLKAFIEKEINIAKTKSDATKREILTRVKVNVIINIYIIDCAISAFRECLLCISSEEDYTSWIIDYQLKILNMTQTLFSSLTDLLDFINFIYHENSRNSQEINKFAIELPCTTINRCIISLTGINDKIKLKRKANSPFIKEIDSIRFSQTVENYLNSIIFLRKRFAETLSNPKKIKEQHEEIAKCIMYMLLFSYLLQSNEAFSIILKYLYMSHTYKDSSIFDLLQLEEVKAKSFVDFLPDSSTSSFSKKTIVNCIRDAIAIAYKKFIYYFFMITPLTPAEVRYCDLVINLWGFEEQIKSNHTIEPFILGTLESLKEMKSLLILRQEDENHFLQAQSLFHHNQLMYEEEKRMVLEEDEVRLASALSQLNFDDCDESNQSNNDSENECHIDTLDPVILWKKNLSQAQNEVLAGRFHLAYSIYEKCIQGLSPHTPDYETHKTSALVEQADTLILPYLKLIHNICDDLTAIKHFKLRILMLCEDKLKDLYAKHKGISFTQFRMTVSQLSGAEKCYVDLPDHFERMKFWRALSHIRDIVFIPEKDLLEASELYRKACLPTLPYDTQELYSHVQKWIQRTVTQRTEALAVIKGIKQTSDKLIRLLTITGTYKKTDTATGISWKTALLDDVTHADSQRYDTKDTNILACLAQHNLKRHYEWSLVPHQRWSKSREQGAKQNLCQLWPPTEMSTFVPATLISLGVGKTVAGYCTKPNLDHCSKKPGKCYKIP